MTNLLSDTWTGFDSHELRILLDAHFGGPGQYSGATKDRNTLYLPLAGAECRVALTFKGKTIIALHPGQSFDPAQWDQVRKEIENAILVGPMKVGRNFSFSGRRVQGSWQGKVSAVQILPPPTDAPQAPVEIAEHPFVLEFPVIESSVWKVTNYRWLRQHRSLTRLLNVLLAGGTSLEPRQGGNLWAQVLRPSSTRGRKVL